MIIMSSLVLMYFFGFWYDVVFNAMLYNVQDSDISESNQSYVF